MSHDRKSRASSGGFQGSDTVESDTLTEYSYETIGTVESDDATTFGDHVRNVMDAMMGCCEDRQMRAVRPDATEDNFAYANREQREMMGMVPSQLQYGPGAQYPHPLPPHPHYDVDSRTFEDSREDNEVRNGSRVRRKGGKKDTRSSRKKDKSHKKKSKTKKEKTKSDTKKKSKGKKVNDDDDQTEEVEEKKKKRKGKTDDNDETEEEVEEKRTRRKGKNDDDDDDDEEEEEVEEKRTRRKGKKSSKDNDEEDAVEEKRTRRKGKKVSDDDDVDGRRKGKKSREDIDSDGNDKEKSDDEKRTRRKGKKSRDDRGSDDNYKEDSSDEKKTKKKGKKFRDDDVDNDEDSVDKKRTRRKGKKPSDDDNVNGDEKRTRRKGKKSSEDSDNENENEIEKNKQTRTSKKQNDSGDREDDEQIDEDIERTAVEQSQSFQTRQEKLQMRDDNAGDNDELRDDSPEILQQEYPHLNGDYNSQDPSHNHKNYHSQDPSHNYEDYQPHAPMNNPDTYHHQDSRNSQPERHTPLRKEMVANEHSELHEIDIDAHGSLEHQEQQTLPFFQRKLALGAGSPNGPNPSHSQYDPQLPLPRGHEFAPPARMQNTYPPGAYASRSPSPTNSPRARATNPSLPKIEVGPGQIPLEVRTIDQNPDDFSYITGPKGQSRSHHSARSHNSSHNSNTLPSGYQDTPSQGAHRRQPKSRSHTNTNSQMLPQLSHSRSQTHTTGHHSRQDYQMMPRNPSQSQTTANSSRQESNRVKVLRNMLNNDASLGSFDETALMEVRIPAGHMGLSLVSTRNGLVIERKSTRSVATGLNAGDTMVALDGVDISKFSPEVVTNLLRTRENQPCRSIVYYPGSAM